MRVRMKTLAAGPDVLRKPGELVDVNDDEGVALIQGGYAERVPGPIETAVAGPAAEAVTTKGDKKATKPKE